MNHTSTVALGEIFNIARGGSPRPIKNYITDDPDGVNWIMIGDTSENDMFIRGTQKRIVKEGVKRSNSGASMVVSLTGQGVLGGSYVDIDTVSVCDAEGDSIGSGANTWQLLKTSHILMKNEDSYEVYTSNKVEGVDCPTLSLDSTGNITEHPSKGEKVSTTVLTLDTDATAEFNVWLNELVLPIYAQ